MVDDECVPYTDLSRSVFVPNFSSCNRAFTRYTWGFVMTTWSIVAVTSFLTIILTCVILAYRPRSVYKKSTEMFIFPKSSFWGFFASLFWILTSCKKLQTSSSMVGADQPLTATYSTAIVLFYFAASTFSNKVVKLVAKLSLSPNLISRLSSVRGSPETSSGHKIDLIAEKYAPSAFSRSRPLFYIYIIVIAYLPMLPTYYPMGNSLYNALFIAHLLGLAVAAVYIGFGISFFITVVLKRSTSTLAERQLVHNSQLKRYLSRLSIMKLNAQGQAVSNAISASLFSFLPSIRKYMTYQLALTWGLVGAVTTLAMLIELTYVYRRYRATSNRRVHILSFEKTVDTTKSNKEGS